MKRLFFLLMLTVITAGAKAQLKQDFKIESENINLTLGSITGTDATPIFGMANLKMQDYILKDTVIKVPCLIQKFDTIQVPVLKKVSDTIIIVRDSIWKVPRWWGERTKHKKTYDTSYFNHTDTVGYFEQIKDVSYTGLCDSTIFANVPKTIFGTLVFNSGITTEEKIKQAQQYLPPGSYMRDGIYLNTDAVKNQTIPKFIAAGFNIDMVARWNNIPADNSPVPFPTGAAKTKYNKNLDIALKMNRTDGQIIVHYLDEETNTQMNKGNVIDYVAGMAEFAITCHANGALATNGGIHTPGLSLLLYYSYLARGLQVQAESFKSRAFSDEMKNFVANPNVNNKLYVLMKKCDTLIHAYKAAGLDMVNMHWKEPFNSNGTAQHIPPGVYKELLDFLKSESGLPVMSNEVEVLSDNGSSVIVGEMLQALTGENLRYLFWFNSKDHNQQLTTATGLTPYGVVLNDFIKTYTK